MIEIRPLCSELALKAKHELNETPELVEESLSTIKAWLEKCPHLRCRTDDQFLVAFLRGCKYSLERTKRKLEAYYTLRNLVPELKSGNRDPLHPKTSKLFTWGCSLPLRDAKMADAPLVSIVRAGHLVKNEEFTLSEYLVMCLTNIDLLLLHDDRINICGQVIIIDNDQVNMTHLKPTTPADFKLLEFCHKEAIPFRFKCIHLINVNPFVTMLFNWTKSFVSDKMLSRIMIHDSLGSLHKHVSPSILPKEYGGTGKSVNELTSEWQKFVLTHRQYLLDDRVYGVDESKRQQNFNCKDEVIQGTTGTFRKLTID